MQPELTTIDLRIHPLDRPESDGDLVERLQKLFVEAIYDLEFQQAFGEMFDAITDDDIDKWSVHWN